MNSSDLFLVFFIGCVLGGYTCGNCGHAIGETDGENKAMHLVEDCWPNKPVWNTKERACWVNGQRVILER